MRLLKRSTLYTLITLAALTLPLGTIACSVAPPPEPVELPAEQPDEAEDEAEDEEPG